MNGRGEIVGYRLIRSGAPDELTGAVGAAIEVGWEPLGPAQVAISNMGVSQYLQTLVLRDKPKRGRPRKEPDQS